MKVLTTDATPEIAALLEGRRRSGLDRFDEIWEGVYHMTPGPSGPHGRVDRELTRVLSPYAEAAALFDTTAFNLGESDQDFRIPDGGYHRTPPLGLWFPTAAVIVEILSPADETFEKFPFYAAHGVEEILVADPAAKTVQCWALRGASYAARNRSEVLDVDMDTVRQAIRWP